MCLEMSTDQAGGALDLTLLWRTIGHPIVQEARVAMLQGREDGHLRLVTQEVCRMVTRHQQVRNCKTIKTHLDANVSHLM